jgi:hypothetical protein
VRRAALAGVLVFCLGAGDWGYRDGSGMSVDAAHTRTSGRPDVVIAVLGSGIQWDEASLASKVALSLGELEGEARPRDENGGACAAGYDCNGDGTFTVADYAKDPRLAPLVPDECYPNQDPSKPTSTRLAGDLNRNCILDPGDLVLLFSNGVDEDANGYTDDIAGWDFFANDNDPYDDARAGHGTAQAKAVFDGCPSCRYVPIRVADDFVGEANDFAQGLIYAADAKVVVASAGLFTVDQTAFSKAAIDYAYEKNVLVVTAIGDASSRAHTMPATANHVLTVAGVRYEGDDPTKATSFTQTDGCSNEGPHLSLSASTTGCSRDGAARIAGIAGLVYSAAADAKLSVTAEEAIQLFRAQVDPIGSAGFDPRFGYGRANAARLVDAVKAGQLPPEVDLVSPAWFTPVFATPGRPAIRIDGRIAAPRASRYDVAVQFAPGTRPAEADFRDIVAKRIGIPGATITGGTTPIAQLDPAQIDTAQDPDRSITIRVRVTAHYEGGGELAGEARRVIEVANQKNGLDEDLLAGFPIALGASIEASPKLADIDGDGVRDIVVADSAGKLHVFVQKEPSAPQGQREPAEATGFPYLTRPLDGLNKDLTSELSVPSYAAAPAYSAQTGVDAKLAREALVSAPGIGDVDGDGKPEIVFASWPGTIYVINAKGQDLPGWPQRLPLVPSCPLAPATGAPTRCADPDHRWARGTSSAPVLADLDGDGRAEIILTTFDGRVLAYAGGGTILPGFPVDLSTGRIMSTPTAVDLDGDGRPEIIAGSNPVYAIDARGMTLPKWPVPVDGRALTPLSLDVSAVSTDLDADGRADVIVSANAKTPPGFIADPTFVTFFGSPALGDVDQDGVPDLIVSGGAPSLADLFTGSSATPRPAAAHRVAIFSGRTGQLSGSIPVEDFASLGDHAIADVSGDEYPEIITGTRGFLLHAADACGREAKGFPKNTSGWLAGTPAVGDIDGDLAQNVEVVAGTREGYLFAWKTRGTANGKVLWESFHHDNANTGATSTRLAQGTRERAAQPLVCDAPKAPGPERFDLEGCAMASAGPRNRWASLSGLLAGLALALRRRRS